MKVKNNEILNAVGALNKLLEVKLPVRTSFQIAKLASKIKEPLEAFNKVRDGLVKTYGVTSEQGTTPGSTIIKTKNPEDLQKFADEFEELMNQETELVVDTIKLPEKVAATCDACHHNMDKSLEIEPAILVALERFISVG